jgi:hypothetical protein
VFRDLFRTKKPVPPRSAARRVRTWQPALESMEDRITPAVVSTVSGGVLSITGTFNDSINVASTGGLVKINGADPDSGAASASAINHIVVNPGAGSNNVDLRNVLTADFTSLLDYQINGGTGDDTYRVSSALKGTIDSGNQASRVFVQGNASDVTLDEAADTLTADGVQIDLLGSAFNLSLGMTMSHLVVAPEAGGIRTLSDDGAANDGVSRLFDNATGRTLDFRNPTATLTIRDQSALNLPSDYRFVSLDALGVPALVEMDANGLADTLTFGGSATNVTLDETTNRVLLDSFVVSIPNSAAANLRFTGLTTNLTFLTGGGGHRALTDDAAANNGMSRLYTYPSMRFIGFRNPTGSLTLRDGGAGSNTYEFNSLDAVGAPASLIFDAANQSDQFRFTRNGNAAVIDQVHDKVTLDGIAIAMQNASAVNLLFDATLANLTMLPKQGASVVLSDDLGPNNGISRLWDHVGGTLIEFRNPTTTLAVRDTNALGGSRFEFAGIDAISAPGEIILDAAGRADLLAVTGAYADVVVDRGADLVDLDGLTIKTPNAGAANWRIDATMQTFAVAVRPGDRQIVQDDGTANDGVSRILNATAGSHIDFRNPTDLVTLDGSNAGGNTFEFVTLDDQGAPTDIDLDFGTHPGNAVLRVPGLVGFVSEDRDSQIFDIDNWSIGVFGDGANKVVLDMQMAVLEILPDDSDFFVVSDNPTPHDGFSRASSTLYGAVTDFRNPFGILIVDGANGVGGSMVEFNGLDVVSRPQAVQLNVGSAIDVFRFTGKATNVIDDIDNASVVIDGLQIDLCGCGVDMFFDMDVSNLTFVLPKGEGWTIQDDSNPNDGISQLQEEGSPFTTYFRNPTAKLALLQDGGSVGNVEGLDAVGKPTTQDIQSYSLSKLREDYGFKFSGSYYQSFAGQNEKWFQDRTGQWYAVFPSGRLAKWNGGTQFTTIANVDPSVYQNPQLLFAASVTLSSADQTQLDTIQQAHGFRYTGTYWENYLGLHEKWFKDQSNAWYVILPNGDIKAWLGGSTLGSAIATVNAFIFDVPAVLLRASLAPAAVQQLQQVQQAHGFRFMNSFWQNYLGLGEKWFVDRNGAWHVITSNGDVSKWNGGTSLTFVATVDPAAYADPWLLLQA